jgi:predicted  nucleic acid-binding Zn-ribbon protein
MGLGDIFKGNKAQSLELENQQLKAEIEKLTAQNAELTATIQPEHHEIKDLHAEVNRLKNLISESESTISGNNNTIAEQQKRLEELKKEVVETEEIILLQSMGIYEPTFNFATSDEYKEEIQNVRDEAKQIIKNGVAVTGNLGLVFNGSGATGRQLVESMQKLLLRAFNSEADELIKNVKYNNYDSYVKKIEKCAESIGKLGMMLGIHVSEFYKNNKIKELTLAHEYAIKKQQEKEEQKEIKARMREEAKLQKEIEEERKKLEKEQTHYQNALAKLNAQLEKASENEKAELLSKKEELLGKIEDTEKAIKDVDYREANKRAGYVYVISNIGAFGENVYKIGMTRRLDPMERIYELGDASVPFNFDVHAMIFSDDAPKLESALHKAFEDKKVNMVNHRREFFKVSLDEIKKVIKENYDKTVEFVDLPEAEQFRISEKMRQI